MNLIVSGWPGAGSTSLALITATLLHMKYMAGGGLWKLLAEKAVGTTSGPEYVVFEKQYGLAWDVIWEKYIAWKLKNSENIILDAKLGGFLNEAENVFEVMLIATGEVREGRAVADQRLDAVRTIVARDQFVRERWVKEYGIDIYDLDLIRESFDLVLDNSHMTIAEELELLFKHLEEDSRYPQDDLGYAKELITPAVEIFLEKGKQHFQEQLFQRGEIILPHHTIAEWKQHFPEVVAELPDRLREVVDSIS